MSMNNSDDPTASKKNVAVVEVLAADLQGPGVIACPNPKMALWSAHPKIFIDVVRTGEGKCSYCGTLYRLRPGEKVHGH